MNEAFWDQKRGGKWTQNALFRLSHGTNLSVKTHVLSPCWGCLGLFGVLVNPKKKFEGPEMHTNVPQQQRMQQKDQEVTWGDTKIDSKVACKGTKLSQNAKQRCLLQLSPSTKS